MARPHAVVMPYPGAGNINPALQIAKLLHHHGVYITFVNSEHNHRLVQDTEGADAVLGRDGFRFEAIPDGLSEADRGKQDYGQKLLVSTTTRCAGPLRDLIERLNGTPGVPPVTCVLPTGMMTFALGVARDLGIPSMVLWCAGAASLMAHMRMQDLKERGYVPLKGNHYHFTRILLLFTTHRHSIDPGRHTDESFLTNGYLDKTIIDWIPGVPPISLGDVSSFVRTTDPDDFGLAFGASEPSKCTKAGGLILNTFEDLDADVLAALRSEYTHIYTVGPLGTLLRHGGATGSYCTDSTGLSLWKQNAECLGWLDTQEAGSVVYINFGSHTLMTPEQLAEFAWGLAASGHPFLWSIRDDNVVRSFGGLPPAFVAETAGRCHVTTWCPQEQVLRHPAVGCFLTHNGWNSTCESLAAGVPMVCWPGFADQYTNCKYACEVWGVGVRLDAEVRREQVAVHVREAMGSEEIKASAARWKTEALVACCPGGSSYENLLSMVRALGISPNSEA
ncbi:7-deoxyloganetin glucosyltransferase [Dichanthelium oligosanthes]|uniref:7-deoxyloganetin glucosyltransferase n=1 Tax=Dichanthelium oligosanthes TaxID=888268 RepID=A0A1E5V607_9POAL|nr:7-deoxyloganetin glucosyltransferase [Dichanthelium oligosanthes]